LIRIVYLHGFASGPSSTKARFFRTKLEERGAEVEVPDLAEDNFRGLTITSQLRVIERACGTGRVSLMGSSLGGYLAALYAGLHPGGVDRVVLLAPGFGFPTRWPDQMGADRMEEWRRTGWTPIFHYATGREEPLGYQMVEDARLYPDAPSFRQPALIFHGVNDSVVPAQASVEFARSHANVALRLLQSGHELTDVLELMWSDVAPFLLEECEAR
jgi:pimeloyl-ACP methyl ester carboxylesterase